MWYKNIPGRFFGLVTKQVCDRRTDGITTQLHRAVKMQVSFVIIST